MNMNASADSLTIKHYAAGKVAPILIIPVIIDNSKQRLLVLNVALIYNTKSFMNFLTMIICSEEQKKIASIIRDSLSPVSAFK